jgi:fatty acid desaturase
MLDLRVAFTSRIAIHCFFLTALILLGLVPQVPMLLVVALVLLAAELPLARLVRARRPGEAAAASGSLRAGSLANQGTG